MNINALYRHPSELEAEAMLSREQAYPDDFRWQTEQQNV
jgi:hypothetical protein